MPIAGKELDMVCHMREKKFDKCLDARDAIILLSTNRYTISPPLYEVVRRVV